MGRLLFQSMLGRLEAGVNVYIHVRTMACCSPLLAFVSSLCQLADGCWVAAVWCLHGVCTLFCGVLWLRRVLESEVCVYWCVRAVPLALVGLSRAPESGNAGRELDPV